MNPIVKLFCGAVFLLSTTTLSAHAQPPSIEEQAVGFRQGVFQSLSWKVGQLAGAKAQNDRAAFQKHADDLAYLTGLITEGFIANSLVADSKAKPSVWEDSEGFHEAAKKMQGMAAEIAAADYDINSFDARSFGREGCGGCHKNFKERD